MFKCLLSAKWPTISEWKWELEAVLSRVGKETMKKGVTSRFSDFSYALLLRSSRTARRFAYEWTMPYTKVR